MRGERIGKALLFATLLLGLSLAFTLQGEGLIWGRATRSLAAVAIGATVHLLTIALLCCALTGVVFVFLPFKRDPLQIVLAWGAGIVAGAIAAFVVCVAGGILMTLISGGPTNVPDSTVTVLAAVSAWIGVFVLFALGMLPRTVSPPN